MSKQTEAMKLALRIALENLDSMESLGPTTEAVIDAAQKWYLAEQPAQPKPSHSDLKLAEQIMSDCGCSTNNQRLLERITERLAKHRPAQQQEPRKPQQRSTEHPVAYAVYHRMGGGKSLHWPEQHSEDGDHNEYQLVPLYTSPPASQSRSDVKPLHQEHIFEAYRKALGQYVRSQDEAMVLKFARAIEAAHGIKENT